METGTAHVVVCFEVLYSVAELASILAEIGGCFVNPAKSCGSTKMFSQLDRWDVLFNGAVDRVGRPPCLVGATPRERHLRRDELDRIHVGTSAPRLASLRVLTWPTGPHIPGTLHGDHLG